MSTAPDPRPPDPVRLADIEAAADAALLAPSVRNTQPWVLVLHPDRVDLRADRSRQLHTVDPAGRELLLSVGAAVLNTRVELAARGHAVEVDRRPRTGDPDLAAVVRLVEGPPDRALAALAPQVTARRTNRRGYVDDPVPAPVLEVVRAAAATEDTVVVPVRTEEQHRLVAELARTAEADQEADPAPRHGRRTWAGPDGGLVVLATHADDPCAWVRAGEALERVLLELTAAGWAAGPLSQVTEVPCTRATLRRELCRDLHPQLLLRVGRAVPTPASTRRDRRDVVRGGSRPEAGPPTSPCPGPGDGPATDGHGGATWV